MTDPTPFPAASCVSELPVPGGAGGDAGHAAPSGPGATPGGAAARVRAPGAPAEHVTTPRGAGRAVPRGGGGGESNGGRGRLRGGCAAAAAAEAAGAAGRPRPGQRRPPAARSARPGAAALPPGAARGPQVSALSARGRSQTMGSGRASPLRSRCPGRAPEARGVPDLALAWPWERGFGAAGRGPRAVSGRVRRGHSRRHRRAARASGLRSGNLRTGSAPGTCRERGAF